MDSGLADTPVEKMKKDCEENKSGRGELTCSRTPEDPIIIPIHSVTAKLYLNRPIEELIPAEHLKTADESSIPSIVPWVFRAGNQNGSKKDLDFWSDREPYFMNLFKALKQTPQFERPLYQGGSEFDEEVIPEEKYYFQGSVMHEFIEQIFNMLLGEDRETTDQLVCHLGHRRCISADMAYLTGCNERHYDAPTPSGFVALQMNDRPRRSPYYIAPVSITYEPESFISAVSGKIKMMLTNLYLNLKAHRHRKADQIPDQEVYLLGLHGSRLHIFHAFFPGKKSSIVWCGRSSQKAFTEASTSAPQGTPGSVSSPAGTLDELDGEPDLRTFRVLATREYDLWDRSDFRAATRALVALFMYMLSSESKIGPIEAVFARFQPKPSPREEETTENEATAEQAREEYDEETEDEAEISERAQNRAWLGFGEGCEDFDLFADYVDESAGF
ncbi:hypothetical protein Plec18170_008500 [Paecilomyces lecythidis]